MSIQKPNTFPVTVTVPRTFYKDHLNRDCGDTGKILSENQKTYTVSFDEEAWIDLYTDCEVYINWLSTDDYEENKVMVGSAVRTMARLKKVL